MHATRAAVEEGIVAGGGVALLYATKALDGLKGQNDDQTRGIDIVRKALYSPVRQIAQNAGHDGAVISASCSRAGRGDRLQRADRGLRKVAKAGVIDPTKVVRTALQDAASVAGLLITTEAAVSELRRTSRRWPWAAAEWAEWAEWTSKSVAQSDELEGPASDPPPFSISASASSMPSASLSGRIAGR